MARTDHQSVDEYLAAQPAPTRSVLARVRATIRKALPRATEGISYQMPVYKLDGVMVLYIAGYQHHYAIYPASARVVSVLKKELAGFLYSKATLRFSLVDPVPTRLITRIAKLRAAEVAEGTTANEPKPPGGKKVEKKRPTRSA